MLLKLYYEPVPESSKNFQLMSLIDEQYARRIAWQFRIQRHEINQKQVERLMQISYSHSSGIKNEYTE
jgi:hypothetical protein